MSLHELLNRDKCKKVKCRSPVLSWNCQGWNFQIENWKKTDLSCRHQEWEAACSPWEHRMPAWSGVQHWAPAALCDALDPQPACSETFSCTIPIAELALFHTFLLLNWHYFIHHSYWHYFKCFMLGFEDLLRCLHKCFDVLITQMTSKSFL